MYAKSAQVSWKALSYELCERLIHSIFLMIFFSLFFLARPDFNLSEAGVVTSLSQLNSHKATDSDGLKGRVLKKPFNSAREKCSLLFFQLLLDSRIMPRAWKTCKIILVPRKPLLSS